jgi:ubiquinone/menaquinone biosynthesis C-methylase UbiE
MTELEKYQGIYSRQSEYPSYGNDDCGKGAWPMIRAWNPSSLLDLGCGHNAFVKRARRDIPGIRAIGIDFACPGADMIGCMTDLPIRDKAFDVVTSWDALEHIEPCDIAKVLSECARVAHRFAFSICYRDSVFRWQGETLHPTVQPEPWWIEQILAAGAQSVEKEGRYLYGTFSSPA